MDILTLVPPSIYLSLTAGSAAAFLFHAFLGHRHRSGLFYWPFGLAGFFGGAVVAGQIGLNYALVGDVSMVAGIAGALIGLVLAHLLLA